MEVNGITITGLSNPIEILSKSKWFIGSPNILQESNEFYEIIITGLPNAIQNY